MKATTEQLAQALRQYPTWGDAYVSVATVLLDVEGILLAYWTDIPEATIQEVLPKIREALGGFEPAPADEAKR